VSAKYYRRRSVSEIEQKPKLQFDSRVHTDIYFVRACVPWDSPASCIRGG
jgi:hypothetical protein